MNGFERIKSAFEGKMPNMQPIMLHNFMIAVAEYGCNIKKYREDPQIGADCHIISAEKYGLDGPEMISPDMYRKFALEPEKLLLNAAHEESLPYLMHTCGNTDIILQDMANASFDAVGPDFKTPMEAIFKHFFKVYHNLWGSGSRRCHRSGQT